LAQEILTATATDGIVPDNSVVDGRTFDISASFGAGLNNGRGHVTGYARYVDQNAVLQGDRDIGRCAIVSFGPDVGGETFCAGSNFGPFPTTLSLPTILDLDGGFTPSQFLVDEEGAFIDAAGNVVDADNAVLAPAGFTGATGTRAPQFITNDNGMFVDAAGNVVGFADAVSAGTFIPGDNLAGRQLPGTTSGTISLDAAGNFVLNGEGNGAGATNAFNFNPDNFFQRPTQRIQGGFFANYEVTPNIEAYLDATFFRNETDAQIAPSATFGEVSQVNCDNPFLTPELVDAICTTNNFGPTDLANVQVNRRFVEAGGRNSDIELNNIRVVGGFQGQIGDTDWDYDAFGQFSTTSQSTTNSNDGNIELLNEALQVELDAAGNPVCTSGREGCIPLNLFGTGPVDPVALGAILTPTIETGEVTQQIVGATVQGSFEEFKSPFAETPVNLLFGIEFRRDNLESQPDSILLVGGSTGLGGPANPVDSSADVLEFFGEANVTLAEDLPFADNLSVTGQLRFSDYSYVNNLPGGLQSDGFDTTAFSVGANWSPISDIRLRGQFQRAVRAPNVFELFSPQSLALFDDSDPCSGAVGTPNLSATAAQCALTGLPTALFGAVPEDAGQLQQLTGGNTNLQPEESDTFTVGVIYQPSYVEGLTLSVDYYDISVDDFISSIPPTSILDGCIDGSQPDFCTFINRDELGTLQIDGFVDALQQNIAERVAQGVDIAASYNFSADQFGLGDYGDFSASYVGNIVTALEQTSFPGADLTVSDGLFGGDSFTGTVNPEYRHVANLGWTPNDKFDFNISWRYIGSVENDGDLTDFDGNVNPDAIGFTFGAEHYFDLFGQYNVNENFVFSAGINNVTGNDPSFSDFRFTSNGTTFPETYDAIGRYIFVGGKIRL